MGFTAFFFNNVLVIGYFSRGILYVIVWCDGVRSVPILVVQELVQLINYLVFPGSGSTADSAELGIFQAILCT